eukprot:3772766-Ditylum_brightwellii.AAC.1
MRLSGRDVYFLSGTDEHGQSTHPFSHVRVNFARPLGGLLLQKVEKTAAEKGLAPKDFVDEVSLSFRELLDLLNISNDYFIRTTDEDHMKAVQEEELTMKEPNHVLYHC